MPSRSSCRRRRRRRELLFQEGQGAVGHDRRDQGPRPRSGRVGVGQDSAEAPGQDQRRNAGPRREPGGQRRRPRQGRPVPPADRPEVAAAARRGRHGVAAGGRGVDRADAAVGRDRARRSSMQAQQNLDAPAGSLEAAADDARGARKGGERRQGRRVGVQEREKQRQAAGEPHQCRRGRRSRARATT